MPGPSPATNPAQTTELYDRGQVSKREKKVCKKFRDAFGHTLLSIEEEIPWNAGGW